MKGLLERKYFTAEVKDVDIKSRTITGWWASYGNKDHDNDIIEPGAARKSIMERGPNGSNEIFFLNHHKWNEPHGRPSVLIEDAKGIYFEAQMAVSPTTGEMTSYSKDALILYEAGVVLQHSIGFNTIKSDSKGSWAEGNYVRHIKEIALWEGSNVTLGANPNTPFTGFKSLTMEQVNDQIKTIVKLIKNGHLTDETFTLLEIGLKELQLHSYELGKKSLEEQPEPDAPTPEVKEPNTDIEIINVLKNFSIN